MLYVVAILCPPLAVLLSGKPGQALVNLLLTLLLYVPGLVHAIIVVANRDADRRADRVVRAVRGEPDRLEQPKMPTWHEISDSWAGFRRDMRTTHQIAEGIRADRELRASEGVLAQKDVPVSPPGPTSPKHAEPLHR